MYAVSDEGLLNPYERFPPRSREVSRLRTSYLVEGVASQAPDVKAAEHELRLRRFLHYRRDIASRQVHRDELQLRTPLVAEGGEELAHSVGVPAAGNSYDASMNVVSHDGEVVMVPAVRDFVDADLRAAPTAERR
jgi:hypothetical protein